MAAETANQPTNMPTRKVLFGSIASLIAFVAVFCLKTYALPDLDSNLTGALYLLVTAAAGPAVAYLVPDWKLPENQDTPFDA